MEGVRSSEAKEALIFMEWRGCSRKSWEPDCVWHLLRSPGPVGPHGVEAARGGCALGSLFPMGLEDTASTAIPLQAERGDPWLQCPGLLIASSQPAVRSSWPRAPTGMA